MVLRPAGDVVHASIFKDSDSFRRAGLMICDTAIAHEQYKLEALGEAWDWMKSGEMKTVNLV